MNKNEITINGVKYIRKDSLMEVKEHNNTGDWNTGDCNTEWIKADMMFKYVTEYLDDYINQELDRAREEGYQKGWEDGSKGKVFEKIEVETEVTFKDLRDVIEGKEEQGSSYLN